MSLRCYVGVDGGGSKTTCAVAGESGEVLATATRGPSNYHAIGIDAAAEVVGSAIEAAGHDAASHDAARHEAAAEVEIAGLCLALAGVARPDDERAWRGALGAIIARVRPPLRWHIPAAEAVITHDAMAALVGGIGVKRGVVLIAGTGAIAFGVNARGEERRASGWGYLLGDEGSAYWIGLHGLRAVCRAEDERDLETTMRGPILAAAGVTHPRELVRRVYEAWKPVDIAALAPIVLSAAAQGDERAATIVFEAANELGVAASAVMHGLGFGEGEEVDVTLAGGLWQAPGTLRTQLIEYFSKGVDQRVRLVEPRDPPVIGALRLARGVA